MRIMDELGVISTLVGLELDWDAEELDKAVLPEAVEVLLPLGGAEWTTVCGGGTELGDLIF